MTKSGSVEIGIAQGGLFNMRRVYLLRVPPFDPVSGGIRVVYGLYAHLIAKGEIALLNAMIDGPSVGIYPEIYRGNDMDAQKVVRYVLQTPGLMGTTAQTGSFQSGPSTEEIKATSDDIYVFSRIYDTFGVDDSHILFLPILNLKVFKDLKKRERNKTCYLVGKGTNQNKHPKGSIELTRQFATDQQALADLLNECSVLYCYDRLSAMADIARLCGCKVKYFGDFPREEMEKYEVTMNGMEYGFEDVKLDIEAFRENYINLKKTFDIRMDEFIERTQTL